MPPVFGPASPSHSRLWSRAAGSATARDPVADRDDAGLAALEPLLDDQRRARRPGGPRGTTARARSPARPTRSRSRPCPPASPSALSTARAPPASSSRTKAIAASSSPAAERPRPGRPDARRRRRPRGRTPSTSRAWPPSRSGPKTAMPGVPQRVGDAGRQRRLGPDDHQLRGVLARERATTAAGSSGSTRRDPDVRLGRDPGAPRRDQHLVHARLAAQLPGERVLAAAAADDEDAGGHHEGHRGDVTRSGRRRRAVPLRPPRALDGLGPLGADRDEHDRDAARASSRADT